SQNLGKGFAGRLHPATASAAKCLLLIGFESGLLKFEDRFTVGLFERPTYDGIHTERSPGVADALIRINFEYLTVDDTVPIGRWIHTKLELIADFWIEVCFHQPAGEQFRF